MRMLPTVVVRSTFDFLYKYSSIPKTTELSGARRIETLLKHSRVTCH
jgi:hypothetical protein